MDLRHRLLAVLLVGGLALLAMLGGLAIAGDLPPGGTLTDDDGNIEEGNKEAIAAEGITRGCNPWANDLFCPSGTLTRGQAAAFLVRGFELADDGGGDLFVDDDDGSIFESDVAKLGTAGVTLGCNPPVNDRYCPDSVVARDQMATFLTRALGLGPVLVDHEIVELKEGDRVLICSDGLTSMLSDEQIGEIATGEDVEPTVWALVEAANSAGGVDNITVAIVDAADPTA